MGMEATLTTCMRVRSRLPKSRKQDRRSLKPTSLGRAKQNEGTTIRWTNKHKLDFLSPKRTSIFPRTSTFPPC